MNELRLRTRMCGLILYYLRSFALGSVLLGAADYFLLYRDHPLAGLITGGVLLLILLAICVYFICRGRTKLHITPDTIFVDGYKHNSYKIGTDARDHFLFVQSFFEKRLDIGRIKVKGTAFYFIGVPQFAAVRAYLTEVFGRRNSENDPD